VQGAGHVVCHNAISGFGDAMKNLEEGSRALDFYGNEVLSAYDNGLELDLTEGNVRCMRNRFTDTFATLSYQPTYGGPSYTTRNVIVNVAFEQLKITSRRVRSRPRFSWTTRSRAITSTSRTTSSSGRRCSPARGP
jgi:hypothetical protein